MFLFFRFYLLIWERETEHRWSEGADREGEREKQTPCWARSPTGGSILGPQDHDLSQRQMLNQQSHAGAPKQHAVKQTMSR